MKCVSQSYIFNPSNLANLLPLLFFVAILNLAACGSQNKTSTVSSSQTNNVSFIIPDSILASKLDQTAGTLAATVSVSTLNGGAPQDMIVSATNATATLSAIPLGDATFTIVFIYDLPPFGPLVVASASKSITVVAGDNPISFATTDYDTASFDEDGDGLSNLVELDETSTSSPIVALCKLGTAELGSCELGS